MRSFQKSIGAQASLALGQAPSRMCCPGPGPGNPCSDPVFGSISKPASLCRNKMCHQATISDPAVHSGKPCRRRPGEAQAGRQHGGPEGAFLSALAGSRKLFIATPFPARLGTRLRVWFFTGPIWRQVFQIKSSPSLLERWRPLLEAPCAPGWFPAARQVPS